MTPGRIGIALAAAASLGALACMKENGPEGPVAPRCVLAAETPSLFLSLGQTGRVRATPSCVGLDAPQVRWTSSAPDVARVDSVTGEVIALQTGGATLRGAVVGVPTAAVDVQVSVNCPGITLLAPTLTPASLTLAVGDTGRVRARAIRAIPGPTCGSAVDTTFTWQSLDTLVAVVDGAGLVTGRRSGQAVVRATLVASPIQTASLPVTVTARGGVVDPPAVSPTSGTLGIGGTQAVTVNVPILPNAPAGTDTTARFRSSDPRVATVPGSRSTAAPATRRALARLPMARSR